MGPGEEEEEEEQPPACNVPRRAELKDGGLGYKLTPGMTTADVIDDVISADDDVTGNVGDADEFPDGVICTDVVDVAVICEGPAAVDVVVSVMNFDEESNVAVTWLLLSRLKVLS